MVHAAVVKARDNGDWQLNAHTNQACLHRTVVIAKQYSHALLVEKISFIFRIQSKKVPLS